MKFHKPSRRGVFAFLLFLSVIFSLFTVPTFASSIQDGATTATMSLGHRETILETSAGTRLRACAYNYTTDNGLSGTAYCIDHGLDFTSKTLPIDGKYLSSPVTAGVYANGYPSHSLSVFLGLFLPDNPILSGLTESEYQYATQLAIWASLGQLGIAGTNFTNGREYIEQPTGDTQQMRVFRAVQLLLWAGKRWDRVYQTGMYIRTEPDLLGGNVAIPADMTLDFAANQERYGFKRETINGTAYYTHEYYVASATSTYYDNYNIELWCDNAPAGMMFTDMNNVELPHGTFREKATWSAPTVNHYTNINYNGYEYWGHVKLCLPVDTTPNSGEITINSASYVMQYDIFLALNETNYEQSYILADPSQGTVTADAVLSWGGPLTEHGRLEVLKVDGNGNPLAGAKFTLSGTDGSILYGESGADGKIRWDMLDPLIRWTLTEYEPPAGFGIAEPMDIQIEAARTNYVTVINPTVRRILLHKQDKQSGYSLQGCVYTFEQIDGSFTIDKKTDHAGNIQLTAEELPIGSYRVYEKIACSTHEKNDEVYTVNWDGLRDVTIYAENARKKTLVVYKCSEGNHYALPHAVIDVFKDGEYITTVTTNDAGLAYVTDVTSGYWECLERVAPEGYALNTEKYGIRIDNYDPTTTDDPRIVIPDKELPTLRILKYSRPDLVPLENVSIEVWCDGVSLGIYKTDSAGEILVTGHEGTFYVQEHASLDTHILQSDPQQIELKAGDGIKTIVLFNDKKPGLHLTKLSSEDLSTPIQFAKFKFTAVDGSWGPQELTTGADGSIDLSRLTATAMVVEELECPGYVIDNAQRVIELKANENMEFVFTNSKLPSLHLTKMSSDGTPLAGVSYRLSYIEDGTRYLDRTTSSTGEITWEGLNPGVVSLQETATVSTHILDPREYHVELFPGKTSEIVLENDIRPNLYVYKYSAEDDRDQPIPGTVFTVRAADGHSVDEIRTDSTGKAELKNLLPGVYEISEKSVPEPWLMDAEPQFVTLYPNRDHTAYFYNHRKPDLTVKKVSSITGEPLRAKFQVTYAGNNTATGEINDLGTYWTEDGEFTMTGLRDGWYKVQELEPSTGYSLPDPAHQEFYIKSGQSKTVTFEDTPLSAIVIWKYDTVTGLPVQSTFQLRYLTDTSGTGGTVIGTYTTSASTGACTITNLKKGSYVVEEIFTDSAHVISEAPQTVFLSGRDQDIVSVYFGNVPKGSLLVKKVASGGPDNGKPLSDTEFIVTKADGSLVGNSNGKYVTDSTGSFLVENQDPGTALIVRETRARSGYLLDDTAQTAIVKPGVITNLEFRNQALGNLLIVKRSSTDNAPLEGVQFKITYADGSYVDNGGGTLSSNGIYYTNRLGQVKISSITGTVVVTEEKSVDGFSIDENTRTQTVTVNPGDTQTLYFYNAPSGGVEIIKVSEADNSERIPNTTYEIRRMDGGLVTTATTDKRGRFYVSLEAGGYYALEVKANSKFKLDNTPAYFEVKDGRTTTLTLTNKPFSGILLHKYSTTGESIYGATFLLYDDRMTPIGQYTSDQNGYVYIDDLAGSGRYHLRELSNDGYVVDTQIKTVYVKAGETTTVEWANTPIRGQIQIIKRSADNNTINGFPKGTLLEGAVFEIYDKAGNVVDTIKTDSRGRAVSKLLPLSRYTAVEVKAPANYSINPTVLTAYLEYEGQIVTFDVEDESVATGVSIQKTGPAEVIPGQPIRYTLSGISNTSTVALESFYWRDTLPGQITLTQLVTGTYDQALSYKVVYTTNLSGEYHTLADNLSTTKNYVLDARPATLGLAANERITEVMYVFGQVNAGFAQVETPYINGTVNYGLSNGSSIVNVADVGGLYNGQWVQAVTRWNTGVYVKTTLRLPKTGY